jgi:hypothetical protein
MSPPVYFTRETAPGVQVGEVLWTQLPARFEALPPRPYRVRVVGVRTPALARTGTLIEARVILPAPEDLVKRFEPEQTPRWSGPVEIDAGYFWRD